MGSTDDTIKTEENITAPVEQQTSTQESVPTFDPSAYLEHSQACDDPTHNHTYPNFFNQNDQHSAPTTAKNGSQVKRKGKKTQQKDSMRAEFIPGHRGDRDIDELVNFINGSSSTNNNTNEKKQKKKLTTTTTTQATTVD
jgi:hypothetical protein